MLPTLVDAPLVDVLSTEPRAGTHAHSIFQLFVKFAQERANKLLCGRNARFILPVGAYMLRRCRLDIVYAVLDDLPDACQTDAQVTRNAAYNALCVKVPLLAEWEWRDAECDILMQALYSIKREALQDFMERRCQRTQHKDKVSASISAETPMLESSPSSLVVVRRERDNAVAMEVAAHAEQTTSPADSAIDTVDATPPVLSNSNRRPRRLLQEQTPSQVNKRVAAAAPSPVNKRLRTAEDTVNATPKVQRTVLTFTPRSSRGRVRTLTSKGQENYQ